MEVCQNCGRPIQWGGRVVAVRYGIIGKSAHPHTRVTKEREDYFHDGCEVGIVNNEVGE
jgi:hypothetical protein